MPDRLRVVIAEDHYLVREGVRALLEDSGEVDVVAAVSTAVELLDAVAELAPDAVLTDIRMPPSHHMEGIEAAHRIRAEYPDVGVVVLSQHADEGYAFALLKNGTGGLAYLLKDRIGDLDELLRTLREVCAGRSALDPRVVDALVARRSRRARSGLDELTPRELDVMREMARGKTNSGIAEALFLSESDSFTQRLDVAAEAKERSSRALRSRRVTAQRRRGARRAAPLPPAPASYSRRTAGRPSAIATTSARHRAQPTAQHRRTTLNCHSPGCLALAGCCALRRGGARGKRHAKQGVGALKSGGRGHPRPRLAPVVTTTTTSSARGPWTPSTRSSSMSDVAEGPDASVIGLAGPRRPSAAIARPRGSFPQQHPREHWLVTLSQVPVEIIESSWTLRRDSCAGASSVDDRYRRRETNVETTRVDPVVAVSRTR